MAGVTSRNPPAIDVAPVGPLTRVESRPVRLDDVVHAMATGRRLAIRSRVGHRPPVVAVKARTEPDPSPAGWR